MYFFLQSEPKVGKSYLLQKIFSHNVTVTGYTTQRLYLNGKIVAYRGELIKNNSPVIPLDGLYDSLDINSSDNNIFLDMAKKFKDVTILENMIKEVKQNTINKKYDFVMLDEIGGFETESNIFMENLFEILENNNCIGVIKPHSRSMNNVDNKNCSSENYNLLVSKIKSDGEIYTMTHDNKIELEEKFFKFI